nr:MAG: capsid protein [Cressdnaviricota sp.]
MRRKTRAYRRKRRVKRRVRRTYRRSKRYSRKSRMVSGIKTTQWVRLKYGTEFEISNTGFTYAAAVYRGNSIYDPLLAVGGTSAALLGFYSNNYASYYVRSSYVKAYFYTIYSGPLDVFVYPSFQSSAITVNPLLWIEMAGVKQSQLDSSPYGTKQHCTIRYKKSSPSMTGVKDRDSTLCSAVGSNPSNAWFWWFAINTINGGTSPACLVKLIIYFDVLFFDRKENVT